MANQITSRVAGIYAILSTIDDRFYIGKSKNVIGRWATHLRDLVSKKHDNKHLQSFFNKYGEDSISFVLIEESIDANLSNLEKKYIKLWEATDCGFNMTQGGDGGGKLKEYLFEHILTGQVEVGVGIQLFAEKVNLCYRSLCDVQSGRIPHFEGWFCPKFNRKPKKYKLIGPNGEIEEFFYIKGFCDKHKLNKGNISMLLNYKRESVSGWKREDSKEYGDAYALSYQLYNPNGERVVIRNLSKFCRENGFSQGSFGKLVIGKCLSVHGWSVDKKYCKKYDKRLFSNGGKRAGKLFNKKLNIIAEFESLQDFCREYKLLSVRSQIGQLFNGQREEYRGWVLSSNHLEPNE